MVYRPTEKTEARRKAQHALLLSSASKVVAEHGFQGLTIQAVAEEADVATGTVYKYFVNKAALCAEVFRKGTQKEVDQVQAAAFPEASDLTCYERLSDAVQRFAERAIEGPRMAYALIAEPVDPGVEAERLVYRKAYANIFSSLIEEGIEKKEFVDQDAFVSATAMVGALAESLIGPLSQINHPGQDQFNVDQFIQQVQNYCMRAVAAS